MTVVDVHARSCVDRLSGRGDGGSFSLSPCPEDPSAAVIVRVTTKAKRRRCRRDAHAELKRDRNDCGYADEQNMPSSKSTSPDEVFSGRRTEAKSPKTPVLVNADDRSQEGRHAGQEQGGSALHEDVLQQGEAPQRERAAPLADRPASTTAAYQAADQGGSEVSDTRILYEYEELASGVVFLDSARAVYYFLRKYAQGPERGATAEILLRGCPEKLKVYEALLRKEEEENARIFASDYHSGTTRCGASTSTSGSGITDESGRIATTISEARKTRTAKMTLKEAEAESESPATTPESGTSFASSQQKPSETASTRKNGKSPSGAGKEDHDQMKVVADAAIDSSTPQSSAKAQTKHTKQSKADASHSTFLHDESNVPSSNSSMGDGEGEFDIVVRKGHLQLWNDPLKNLVLRTNQVLSSSISSTSTCQDEINLSSARPRSNSVGCNASSSTSSTEGADGSAKISRQGSLANSEPISTTTFLPRNAETVKPAGVDNILKVDPASCTKEHVDQMSRSSSTNSNRAAGLSVAAPPKKERRRPVPSGAKLTIPMECAEVLVVSSSLLIVTHSYKSAGVLPLQGPEQDDHLLDDVSSPAEALLDMPRILYGVVLHRAGLLQMDNLAHILRQRCGCVLSEPRFENRAELVGYWARAGALGIGNVIRGGASLLSRGITLAGGTAIKREWIPKAGEQVAIASPIKTGVRYTRNASHWLSDSTRHTLARAVKDVSRAVNTRFHDHFEERTTSSFLMFSSSSASREGERKSTQGPGKREENNDRNALSHGSASSSSSQRREKSLSSNTDDHVGEACFEKKTQKDKRTRPEQSAETPETQKVNEGPISDSSMVRTKSKRAQQGSRMPEGINKSASVSAAKEVKMEHHGGSASCFSSSEDRDVRPTQTQSSATDESSAHEKTLSSGFETPSYPSWYKPEHGNTAKTLGLSSLMAGVEIFSAIYDATGEIVSSAAHVTAEVVGHRYGEDAKAVAQDGVRIAQNVIEIKEQLTGKAVATQVAKESLDSYSAYEASRVRSGAEWSNEGLPDIQILYSDADSEGTSFVRNNRMCGA
ncbi:unnamed protein product [Amoebophrya sp. A25]|nr:unnamed protein product [Amoebophrya sp. A25]|eukprot:GSA25T00007773001.1